MNPTSPRSIIPPTTQAQSFFDFIGRIRRPRAKDNENGSLATKQGVLQEIADMTQDTEQDVKKEINDLEKLQAWPAVMCDAVNLHDRWNKVWRKRPVKMTGEKVDALLRVDLRNLFIESLDVAELGHAMGAHAMDLCKSIQQGQSTLKLEESVRHIFEITDKAIKHTDDISARLEKIHRVISEVERLLRSSGYVMKSLAVDLFALKRLVLDNLKKHELFITILIDWWKSVRLQLDYVQRSVEVMQQANQNADQPPQFQSHKYWEEVEMIHSRYISEMHQLQDRYPALLGSTKGDLESVLEA